MIINIPTSGEFHKEGRELLEYAWSLVTKLLVELDDIKAFDSEIDIDLERYSEISKRSLTTALSITHQGVEFIIKGRIASVSPYLLIAEPANRWAQVKGDNIDFTELHTLNAKELVKVHNKVCELKISSELEQRFHELRIKRNNIIHSVSSKLIIQVIEVVDAILFIHKEFFPCESWAETRLSYSDFSEIPELDGNGNSIIAVSRELSLVLDLLGSEQVRKYFGIEKDQKRYFCPDCFYSANSDYGLDDRLAVIQSDSSDPNLIFCILCNEKYTVKRTRCILCNENVLNEENVCLACGKDNDPP